MLCLSRREANQEPRFRVRSSSGICYCVEQMSTRTATPRYPVEEEYVAHPTAVLIDLFLIFELMSFLYTWRDFCEEQFLHN